MGVATGRKVPQPVVSPHVFVGAKPLEEGAGGFEGSQRGVVSGEAVWSLAKRYRPEQEFKRNEERTGESTLGSPFLEARHLHFNPNHCSSVFFVMKQSFLTFFNAFMFDLLFLLQRSTLLFGSDF